VLYWLPQDLPNRIVSERLCDPPGKKLFDAELIGRPSAVPLAIALIIGDLGRLGCAVARQTKTDELVFKSNLSLLLLQEDRNIQEQTPAVHVFECLLFKQLCAKNSVTAIRIFHLYAFFWQKVIRIAVETESNALLFHRVS
jgi:hypothetical protein